MLQKLLKTCAPELATLLDKLFQYSYNTGIRLTMWKIDQVRVRALDIKATFDQVWHQGVRVKLESMGIRGQTLCWLKSYLAHSKMVVVVGGHMAQLKACGLQRFKKTAHHNLLNGKSEWEIMLLSRLMKPKDNGVTFRSGLDTGIDSGASAIDIDSAIDGAMQLNENFVMEAGKQPVTFENPMFGMKGNVSSDAPEVQQSA
eukprot:g36343.t1